MCKKRIIEASNYDPKTNEFPYTLNTDGHYLEVKKNKGIVFDEKYPYIDKSKGFRFKQWWVRLLLNILVFPLCYIRLGLKVVGRDILRKNKKLIKEGMISISNHVHMWDFIAIMAALNPIKPNILSWDKNINGENGTVIRMVGGIPIPVDNFSGTREYLRAVKKLLTEDHGWLHISAEGSMWEYYRPIRPFKKGAFSFACKYNKPIIPLSFSYRKPGFIRRVIFKQKAVFTLRIGEPIFVNQELNKDEQLTDITIRAHEAICRLANIDPKDNIYGPIFDNSQRIDYYTDTYGVNYKGSR